MKAALQSWGDNFFKWGRNLPLRKKKQVFSDNFYALTPYVSKIINSQSDSLQYQRYVS